MAADLLQLLDGRLEKALALLGSPLGQLGVAAGHQPLPGKIQVGQLESVSLVEAPHRDRPALEKLLDRPGAKRSDPVDPVDLPQRVDLLLRDHPTVTDPHEPLDGEVLSELADLGPQRLRIPGVPAKTDPETGMPRGLVSRPSLTWSFPFLPSR